MHICSLTIDLLVQNFEFGQLYVYTITVLYPMAATIPREDCLRKSTNHTTSQSDSNIHITKLRPVVIAIACMHILAKPLILSASFYIYTFEFISVHLELPITKLVDSWVYSTSLSKIIGWMIVYDLAPSKMLALES